jgi:hypothetical protein
MASGSSPSSNQRSTLPEDPLNGDATVAIGRKPRNSVRRTHNLKNDFSESASPSSLGLVNVCFSYYFKA